MLGFATAAERRVVGRIFDRLLHQRKFLLAMGLDG